MMVTRVTEVDIAPPTYTDVINSTRYPVLRGSVSSETVLDIDGTTDTGSVQGRPLPAPPQQNTQTPAWRLKFVDFSPHLPTGGGSASKRNLTDFSTLLARANMWLQTNKDVDVKSCETITWWANSQTRLNDTEVVKSTIKTSSKMYFMRGLRLWLVPRAEADEGDTIALGMRDFEPDLTIDSHKDLATFIKVINNRIQEEGLPGTLLSFETVVRRTCPNVRTKDTYWTEFPNGTRTYAFFFRIFYIKGQTSRDMLGVKDFRPERLSSSSRKYEPYECVIQRANEWIFSQITVNVLSIQSVLLKRKDGINQGADKLMYTVHGTKPVAFHQCLRVTFIRPRYNDSLEVIQPLVLSKKTFAPLKRELLNESEQPEVLKYESFSKTVEQISMWLKSKQAELIAVETVQSRIRSDGPQNMGPESAMIWSYEKSVEDWMTYVRIFIREIGGQASDSRQPHSRYLNLPAIGQLWYMRSRSSMQQTSHNRRCIYITLAVLILLILLGIGAALYYFLYYQKK